MQKVEFFVVVVFLIFNFAATVLAKTVAPKFSHALRKKFTAAPVPFEQGVQRHGCSNK